MQEIVYKFKNLNWTLVMSVLFLSLIGLIMIYSASNAEGMSSTYSHLAKLVFGFTVMFLVAFSVVFIFIISLFPAASLD